MLEMEQSSLAVEDTSGEFIALIHHHLAIIGDKPQSLLPSFVPITARYLYV